METVKISGYRLAHNQDGEPFVVLTLMGDVELVQSSITGRFYATSKTANITSTFSPEIADTLIGKQLPGRIDRVDCDPYSYVIPETGEEVTLAHRWDYVPLGQAGIQNADKALDAVEEIA